MDKTTKIILTLLIAAAVVFVGWKPLLINAGYPSDVTDSRTYALAEKECNAAKDYFMQIYSKYGTCLPTSACIEQAVSYYSTYYMKDMVVVHNYHFDMSSADISTCNALIEAGTIKDFNSEKFKSCPNTFVASGTNGGYCLGEQILGGDTKDEHGCYTNLGQEWCDVLKACKAPDICPTETITEVYDIPASPNPAAEYCIGQGGIYRIKTAADGSQTGWCAFPNVECEEWAFYHGTCIAAPDMPQPSDDIIGTGSIPLTAKFISFWEGLKAWLLGLIL